MFTVKTVISLSRAFFTILTGQRRHVNYEVNRVPSKIYQSSHDGLNKGVKDATLSFTTRVCSLKGFLPDL